MNTSNFMDYLDFDLHWTTGNISFTTPHSYEIYRGVYISSSFRPIFRSFVRPSVRPSVCELYIKIL